MKIHFNTLYITCKQSIEEIDLSHHITFFHGKVSSGKSTIARLIDFCLGGEIENTPAVSKELIKVRLDLIIGKYDVIIERDKNGNDALVSWVDNDSSEHFRINMPVRATSQLIFKESIYCLSDLIFYFWDMDVLKVTKNNTVNSILERLSIRNFLWYCYLKQEKLDSSFYRFEESYNLRTTRQTIRFILGYVNQKLVELESNLAKTRESKSAKQSTIAELSQFLSGFNITIEDIEEGLSRTKCDLEYAEGERSKLLGNYKYDTHTSDTKRIKIIKTGESITNNQIIAQDLNDKITKLNSLRLELVSSLYKIDRTIGSNKIFSNQVYKTCPCCGKIVIEKLDDTICLLCKQPNTPDSNYEVFEFAKKDTEVRIKDIENSIENLEKQFNRINNTLVKQIAHKKTLDIALNEELKTYESSYMSQIREFDCTISLLRERIRNLLINKAMPKEISKLQDEFDKLESKESRLKDLIRGEEQKIMQADTFVKELEETFAITLKEVGVPGVGKSDSIRIDTKKWTIKIIPNDDRDLEWGFSEAGSGGKKTLINVCFLLSIHIVAEKNMLDLPNIIIIDTPMKNIDKEVNRDLFDNFYNYLYKVSESLLANTQIIIVDNAIVKPDDNIDFKDRYMTPDEINNPPLISYYFGS